MNKIRKFKIRPHQKEITRRVLKTGVDLKGAGLNSESALEEAVCSFASLLAPGLLYRFFDGHNEELLGAGLESKEMFSVCVLTLGRAPEEALAECKDNPALQTVRGVAFADFLRTAVNFSADLVKEQAEKEEFEVGEVEILYSPVFSYGVEPKFLREAVVADKEVAARALPVLFNILETGKIDAAYEQGEVTPKSSVVFLVPWQKKKKRKK